MPQWESTGVRGRSAARNIAARGLAAFASILAVAGCPSSRDAKPEPVVRDASAPVTIEPAPKELTGDGVHGKDLVLTYQCNRCHDGTGHEAAPQNKHCVHCHKDIMEGRFTAPPKSLARWKPRVKELTEAPSLEALGRRVTRAWLEQYLLEPSDLRPHLVQSMPRLAMTAEDARDIAAYFVPEVDRTDDRALGGTDLGKGRQLLDAKGCGSCHVFTGVAPIAASPPPAMDGRDFERARKLAPDLRVVRDRMTAARLVAWLADPKQVKPDTAMPTIALSASEVRDLAAYLLTAEVTPTASRAKPARLPPLTRRVSYKEVDERVFHRTCWHCHSEPDYAIGDGGPGNSGGFGFKPRGLNLSDYTGIAAGFLDDSGERASVFAKDADGVPRLVRALLARHDEEAGAPTGAVRGMPLGYPALSPDDIQLVDTWIAQGRPR
jgi:mono/diheme cytochrome c family protein